MFWTGLFFARAYEPVQPWVPLRWRASKLDVQCQLGGFAAPGLSRSMLAL